MARDLSARAERLKMSLSLILFLAVCIFVWLCACLWLAAHTEPLPFPPKASSSGDEHGPAPRVSTAAGENITHG